MFRETFRTRDEKIETDGGVELGSSGADADPSMDRDVL